MVILIHLRPLMFQINKNPFGASIFDISEYLKYCKLMLLLL